MNFNSLAGATLEYAGGTLSFNAGTGTYNLGGMTGNQNITLNGNSLSIGSNNGSTTYSGALLLGTGGGGITKTGNGTLTLSNAGNTYNGGTTITNGVINFVSGALGSSGNVTMNGGTLQWASGNTQDLSSRLVMVNAKTATFDTNSNDVTLATGFGSATTGALTKSGAGTLTLSGVNTYTGTTTISAGGLQLSGSLASAIALNAGSLSGTGTTSGSLTTAAGSTLLLSGGATTTGLTTNGVTFGGSTTVAFSTGATSGTTYDVVTYGGGGLTGLANLSSAVRGFFTDTGTKVTFAVGALNAARTWNTTSGTWNINGAPNFAQEDQKFYDLDLVTFDEPAANSVVTLSGQLRPASVTVSNTSNTYTFSGTAGTAEITGTSTLVKNNAGTLILTSAQSYTGGSTINGGTLQLGNGGAGGGFATNGNYVVNAAGTLRVYSGSGAMVAPTWSSITGSGTLALNKDGAGTTNKEWGTATLPGGFTGTLRIEEGRVITADGSSLGGATGVVIESGAQLGAWSGGTFSPSLTISGSGWGESGFEVAIRGGNGTITTTLNGNVTLAASAAVGAFSTGSLVVNGTVAGDSGSTLTIGASSQAGTVALNASNTYAGPTSIAFGTLQVGGSGRLGAGSYAGAISNAGTLLYSSSANQTLSGVISGTGGLTKDTSAASTLTLTNANTYSGLTTVSAGTLAIQGSSSQSRFAIGGASAGEASLTIATSGTISMANAFPSLVVANSANQKGTVTMSGGSLLSLNELWVSNAAGTDAKFYLTSGTVEVQNWTAIGRQGTGLLEISGGLWKNTNAGNFAIGTGGGGTNSSGTVTVKGTGTLEVIGRTLAIRESTGTNSQGTLNISESGVVRATTVDFGLNSASVSGTGTLNVSGGNLWTNSITKTGAATTATITLTGGTLGALSADATWSVPMTFSSGTTSIQATDANGVSRLITVSGALSGAGGLRKIGSGTVTISTAAGSFTGPTTIDAGVLRLTAASALGSGSAGNIAINSGTLEIAANAYNALGAPLTRTVTVNSGGTLLANNTSSNATNLGPLALNGGTLASNATDDGFGNFVLRNVTVGGSTRSTIQSNSIAIVASSTFTVGDSVSGAGTDLLVSSRIIANGAAGVIKAGAGTLELTGSNSYSGGTTLSAGTIVLGNLAALGTGTLTVTGDGGVQAGVAGTITNAVSLATGGKGTFDVPTAVESTFSGVFSGSGALFKSGAGMLTLTSASNDVAGDITIAAGFLRIGGSGRLASGAYSGAIANSGLLDYASSANQTISGSITGNGSLLKSGAGTLTLSAANTYTDATVISAGTLALSGAGSIASSSGVNLSAADAVLDISAASGDRTIAALAGAAGSQVRLGGKSLRSVVAAGYTVFNGVVSGSGGFTKAGADQLELTDIQTFTGAATIEAGSLLLASGTGLASASQIYVASGASIETYGGQTLAIGSAGAQTLGGYGTVLGDLAIASGGVLSPGGSVGTLYNTGTATWNGGMTYVFEVNDANGTPGIDPGWDLFSTTGDLLLSAGPTNQIVIDLVSLTGTATGMAADFDPNSNYAWRFAVAGAPISTYNATWFTVDSSGFQNLPGNPERFYVAQGGSGGLGGTTTSSELYVVYAAVPEPGTLALAGIGLALAGWTAAKRRRHRNAA